MSTDQPGCALAQARHSYNVENVSVSVPSGEEEAHEVRFFTTGSGRSTIPRRPDGVDPNGATPDAVVNAPMIARFLEQPQAISQP